MLRDLLKLSQRSFSDKIGCSNRTLGDWELEKSQPNASYLEAMVLTTEVSAHWLLTGEGPMFLKDQKAGEQPLVYIDVVGQVQAGPNGCFIDDIPPLYRIPCPYGVNEENCFGLEVQGDSGEPRYKTGDVVICVESTQINTGEDCAVILGWGECVLKRWNPISATEVELLSWNKSEYAPIRVQRSEIKRTARVTAHVWGSLLRNMKVAVE